MRHRNKKIIYITFLNVQRNMNDFNHDYRDDDNIMNANNDVKARNTFAFRNQYCILFYVILISIFIILKLRLSRSAIEITEIAL